MRHRSNDLFSRPGTIETESLGSRQIRAKTRRVKRAVRDMLRKRNRESHCLSVALPRAWYEEDYGRVNAVMESSVNGDSRNPPAAELITTNCLPFLPKYVIGVA